MRPSVPGDLLFVSEFIDFMKHVKIFCLTKIKVCIRYFLSARNFARKFISSSCGSLLDMEFFRNFFVDLRMPLVLLEYFGLLSSVYN